MFTTPWLPVVISVLRVTTRIPPLNKVVLLVEDSKFLRLANERALAQAGYSVIGAADGEEALRLAVDEAPDVIVLDMMLPKLSGPLVLQALKRNPATAPIPIIVLSSLPQKNEAKLKSEGAAAYLEKSKLDLGSGSASLAQAVHDVITSCSSQQRGWLL
jgi:CheY-like chemotaxis protein